MSFENNAIYINKHCLTLITQKGLHYWLIFRCILISEKKLLQVSLKYKKKKKKQTNTPLKKQKHK